MHASSRFYSATGLLVILNLIIKPVWIFLVDRQVQNAVSPEIYGQYFSVLGLSIIFSFLLDGGLNVYMNHQLAAHAFASQHVAALFRVKLLMSLLYITIVLCAGWLAGIRNFGLLFPLAAIQVLGSLFLFFRSIITAQQWFRTDAWLSVIDKLMMIIACSCFLYLPGWFGPIDIQRFLWTQLIATALAVFLAGAILISRYTKLFSRGSNPLPLSLFKAAIPYGLIVLLMSAHYRLDGFLLERLHPDGAREAALYAGAYRLLDAANMIGYLLASFLLPYLARQYQSSNDMAAVILQSRHVLTWTAILVAVPGYILAPQIQELLYHNQDKSAILVLQLCLPALLGYAWVQVYGTVLTATGHIQLFCKIVLICLLLNTTLNLWLIPAWGAKAACIAALLSHSLCGISVMIIAHKKCNIPFHARSLLMYIFIGATVAASLYAGSKAQVPFAGLVAIVIVTGIAAAMVARLFNWKEWLPWSGSTQLK